jgi:predicted nucleic acid-binding Zn finger protein
MNQLQIVHKKSTSNKNQKTEQVDLLEKKVRALISSRRLYRLENSNIFYIESSKPNIVYYCRYTFGSNGNFCSCKSFEFYGHKKGDCKHLDMIPIGIMKGKIIDVTALPKDVKRDNGMISKTLSYLESEYSF